MWFSNVPHTRLVEDKGGQNWISRVKDKFKFPGGGTQFIHGADEYLDHISRVLICLGLIFFRRINLFLDFSDSLVFMYRSFLKLRLVRIQEWF